MLLAQAGSTFLQTYENKMHQSKIDFASRFPPRHFEASRLSSAMSNPKGGNRAPSIRIRAQSVVLEKRWTLGPGPEALGPGPWALGPVSRALGPGPRALGPGPWGPSNRHIRQAIDTLDKL